MAKKLITEDFIKKARSIHGKKYDYSKVEYKGGHIPVTIICRRHGEFNQSPSNHASGKGCLKCGKESAKQKLFYTTSSFVHKAEKVHRNKYDYTKVKYSNSMEEVIIKCKIHGEFKQKPVKHLCGQGCPKCTHNARVTQNDFINRAKILHNNKYNYDSVVFTTVNNEVRINCPIHGEFKQKAVVHLNGSGCKLCGNVRISNILADSNSHLRGAGCPKCSNTVSKGESSIAEWLSEVHEEKVLTSVKNKIYNEITGRFLELDIYLPRHGLAIEYNGVYRHSEHSKGQKYHQEKACLCYAKDIRLLQFWDHDVVKKGEIVESIILQALGKTKNRTYARNCEIFPVRPEFASKFFERNHLKGNAGASVHLGLWIRDTLVSCMTFAKPKFDKSYEWEIIRFASKLGYQVAGGASRLFTAFVRQYRPSSIMTYADLMTGTGNVYLQLGMRQIAITKPGYNWVYGKQIISRYGCQTSKLPKLLGDKYNSKLSQKENMEHAGAYRIFDAGNAKFEWFKPIEITKNV